MSLLPIAILFLVGFSTWSLAVVRTFALLKRRKLSVSSMVFAEETVMMWVSAWIAQQYQLDPTKSFSLFAACGLGGAIASYLMMVLEDRKTQGRKCSTNSSKPPSVS